MAEYEVRRVTEDLLPVLKLLGEHMFSESPVYSRLRYNEEKTTKWLEAFVGFPTVRAAWVLFVDGIAVGGLGAAITEKPYLDGKISIDESFYIALGYRGLGLSGDLIEAYEEWATRHGAEVMMLSSTADIATDAADASFESAGFKKIGSITVKYPGD